MSNSLKYSKSLVCYTVKTKPPCSDVKYSVPKAFSQAATFQGYFSKPALPKSVVVAALGHSCSLRPNLTFGKLPLGKFHIWKLSTWESCHLGKGFWEST